MRETENCPRWLDGLAIGASAACLVHCLALPALFALLPALSVLMPSPELIHGVAIIFAVPVSGGALLAGFRVHRLIIPVILGSCGLITLTSALLLAPDSQMETLITVVGSLMIVAAHILNWRSGRMRNSD